MVTLKKYNILHSDEGLRTVAESKIIQILLVWCFAFELRGLSRVDGVSILKKAIEGFVAHGLPFVVSNDGQRLFDPSEVVNFMKWLDINQKDHFWSDYAIPTGRSLVQALANKKDQLDSTNSFQFHIDFSRTFNMDKTSRPDKKVRLRIPIAIADVEIECMKVEFDGVKVTSLPISKYSNFLQVDCTLNRSRYVRLGYRCNLTIKSTKKLLDAEVTLSSEDHSLYTASSEGFISITTKLKDLAVYIVGSKDASLINQVHSLWDWILDNMMIGVIHYHLIDLKNPMEWALNEKIVDCQLGSALLISFCRSLGIPARLIGGYTLYTEAPSKHYWAQIWFEEIGWRSYDLLAWDLSRGGLSHAWRGAFEGYIDDRLVTEIFPKTIIGQVGVNFVRSHHRLTSDVDGKACAEYIDAYSCDLLYKDEIHISC